jgi:low temperature requirement protein LtrA
MSWQPDPDASALAEEERRTSYLELFFDLVFVFAITQVTSLLVGDTSAAGFGRSTLVLFLVWWAWGGYAWMTNAIDVESFGVRIGYLAAMGGSFFMALGVPDAFGDDVFWFAVPLLLVRVLHVVLYSWGLRAEPAHQAAIRKLAPWFLLAPAVVLAGAFVDGSGRTWIWLAAVAIDVGGALSVGNAGFRVSPAHFAERYGLFVIIALGESIVAIGVGAVDAERDLTFALAVAVAFLGVAALWWAYFDITAPAAERALHAVAPERRAAHARDVFSLLHFPMILGIIFFAVAAKKTLEHATDPLSEAGRWALGLGVAVYLMGLVLGRYRAIREVAWERAIGAVAALVVVLVLRDLDATALLAVVVLLLVGVLALETARLRDVRSELHTRTGPPG